MHLADGLVEIFDERGLPARVQGPGPAIHVAFTEREDFFDYRDSLDRDEQRYATLLSALSDRGVRTKTDGLWFLSAAHSKDDIASTLEAAREATIALVS